jgi:hypothetical protein
MSSSYAIDSKASEFTVNSDCVADNRVVIYTYGLRPVINLTTGTLYASGDGTSTNPYVVS